MQCDIDIDIPEGIKNIGINVSGGADSALVTFLLCKLITDYNLDYKIIPMTGIELNRPFNADSAEEIINIIRARWSNVSFAEHNFFEYIVPSDVHGRIRYDLKAEAHRSNELKLFDNGTIDIILAGISQNPPWKDLPEDHPLRAKREKDREANNGYLEKHLSGGRERDGIKLLYHRPLYKSDKKRVAELYHKYNMMDDIFPLTASCIGQAKATNFFTKPCKKCWWCHEKHWAFGMYDGCET